MIRPPFRSLNSGVSPEVEHLGVVRRHAEPEVETPVGALEHRAVDLQLDALVAELADVLQLAAREALRRDARHVHERVVRRLVVVREDRAQTVRPATSRRSPTSHSAVTSGPRSGLPRLSGVNAGEPAKPAGFQVRTASNAPGARPDWPYAARSFSEPSDSDQKSSSLITHDTLAFGYTCSPKPEPNALLPSTRTPAVRKYLLLMSKTFWKKKPAFQIFERSSCAIRQRRRADRRLRRAREVLPVRTHPPLVVADRLAAPREVRADRARQRERVRPHVVERQQPVLERVVRQRALRVLLEPEVPQVPTFLLREVVADREPVRQVRDRRVRQRHPGRQPLDRLLRVVLQRLPRSAAGHPTRSSSAPGGTRSASSPCALFAVDVFFVHWFEYPVFHWI